MRTLLSAASAALLLCGSAALVATPVHAQQAQTKKAPAKKKTPAKADPWANERAMREMIQGGGMVGCFDPSLTGRARLAAERYGGTPCATTRSAAPKPALLSKPWLVGLWVSVTGNCRASNFPTRLRANGSYDRPSDSGSWTLANGQIAFSYRDTGGELVSGQQEASLPIRSNVIRIERLDDNRMRMGNVVLQRCSPNPDAPIKMEGY